MEKIMRPVKLVFSDTTKMMVIHGFENMALAQAYVNKAGNAAPREIIPWLPASKYFFIIIDDQNLEILKTNKDMQLYKKFLSVYSPDTISGSEMTDNGLINVAMGNCE